MKKALKRVICPSLVALFLVSLALQDSTSADGNRPSADGSYQILADSGPTRSVEFSARVEMDGSTSGEATFRDSAPAPTQNESSNGDSSLGESSPAFYVKAEFDCLVVEGNKAVMCGSVTESSLAQYIGRRVLLVVQDNGDGVKGAARDKLTWGLYKPQARNWLPVDSERPDEQASPTTWIATDAEREDDQGVLSEKTEIIGCQTYPLSSYAFIDAKHGSGNIQVRP